MIKYKDLKTFSQMTLDLEVNTESWFILKCKLWAPGETELIISEEKRDVYLWRFCSQKCL